MPGNGWPRSRRTSTASGAPSRPRRTQVASLVVAGYEGQTMSTTAQVLFSDNPDEVLSQLAVVLEYSDDQNSQMRTLVAKAHQLALREQAAKQQLQTIADTEQQLKQDKATLDQKVAQASSCWPRSPRRPPSGRAPAAATCAFHRISRRRVARRSPSTSRWHRSATRTSTGAPGPTAGTAPGLTMVAWGRAGSLAAPLRFAAVHLRPSRLGFAAAAGRPRLLLQPDQPRRDVHRSRHDRQRGQPA